MRLIDIPTAIVEELVRKWRRRLIVGVIALICGVAAVIQAIAAARAALEPLIGLAWSHAAIAGVFVLIMLGTLAALWMAERAPAAPAQEEGERRSERTELIAEAIDLGYTLAQSLREKPRARRRRRAAQEPAPPSQEQDEAPPPAA